MYLRLHQVLLPYQLHEPIEQQVDSLAVHSRTQLSPCLKLKIVAGRPDLLPSKPPPGY